jgi:hypothetical protein
MKRNKPVTLLNNALALAFTLTSPDFKHTESIAKQFTSQGAELQPSEELETAMQG